MKRIKIFLDYKCYPMWIYNERNELICNGIAEELTDDKEIKTILKEIQKNYEELFEDNEITFEYKGFNNEEDKKYFLKRTNQVIEMINLKLGKNYIIENAVKI